MRMLYVDNFILVGQLHALLEAHDIQCMVKNEYLIGGVGELPPTAVGPELWVMDDRDFPRAQELMDAFVASTANPGPWQCPGCGETVEGQFSQCWNCGGAPADNPEGSPEGSPEGESE